MKKRIIITSKNGHNIEVIDNSEKTRQDTIVELSSILKQNNIPILSTDMVSIAIRPSDIFAITVSDIVDDITEEYNIDDNIIDNFTMDNEQDEVQGIGTETPTPFEMPEIQHEPQQNSNNIENNNDDMSDDIISLDDIHVDKVYDINID